LYVIAKVGNRIFINFLSNKENGLRKRETKDPYFHHSFYTTETILKLYNTLVLPTFLYGSENWTLTASQRRRIEAAEMMLLGPLAGYVLYDHKTNDSIRRELQTDCILDKIDECRRNWLLHLQRMPQNRIPLKSYHYSPQGKRAIGRPKKRWREQL
jgi:hypothetical protein